MNNLIDTLSERINQRLASNKESFAEICYDELESAQLGLPREEFEKQITNWILETPLPKQLNVYNSFGQPPLTLFNNDQYVIDIYFWMHHDTSIHDHSFSGAFRVLYGRSLHEEFSINCINAYCPDVMATKIEIKSQKIISEGHTERIEKGSKFTHRLIHLDQPTITLCVRTINDEKETQWHHFPNGLSIHKLSDSEEVIKKINYFQYLFYQNNELSVSFINELVKKWNVSTTMNLYEQMLSGSLGLSEKMIDVFRETVESVHGSSEWYQKYEDFYRTISERYVQFDTDSPGTRILEHSVNTGLMFNEAKDLLTQVYPEGIPEELLDMLEQLKSENYL